MGYVPLVLIKTLLLVLRGITTCVIPQRFDIDSDYKSVAIRIFQKTRC